MLRSSGGIGRRFSEMNAVSCTNPPKATPEQLDLLTAICTASECLEDDRVNAVLYALRKDVGRSRHRPLPGHAAFEESLRQLSGVGGVNPGLVLSRWVANGPIAPDHERTACHRSIKRLRIIAERVAGCVLAAALLTGSLQLSTRAPCPPVRTCGRALTVAGSKIAVNVQHGAERSFPSETMLAVNVQHGAEFTYSYEPCIIY